MGKPTGFLEYERETSIEIAPEERIKNFNEFHIPLSLEEQKIQAARCMDCGVPFCQAGMMIGGMASGCPLNNLIPEWNDMIYNDNWEHAYARLSKTNNFPEFTSRVCPALCEKACTCNINGDPVSVRENERAIIEYAYANGLVNDQPPKGKTDKKVAVIGSGPSGLAVADMLISRGHEVTVYERSDRPGGLLMYGIPNMKLEKEVIDRKIAYMEKRGIRFVLNTEVATGKNVLVIGGGDTGNDCVGTAVREGAKSVTQLEMMPKLPDQRAENNPWPEWPRVCKTDYGQQEAITVYGHDPRIYETTVKEFIKDKDGNVKGAKCVKLDWQKDPKTGRMNMTEVPDSEYVIDCEVVLIAAGFLGSQKYVADSFGVELNERTNVKTACPKSYATNVPKVFVAGDMHRGQSLVVWAIHEGREAAVAVDSMLVGYTNLM